MTDVYAYWRAAQKHGMDAAAALPPMLPTAGAPIARENPQAGLWKVRLVKGGPWVLMQVWCIDAAGKAASDWDKAVGVMAAVFESGSTSRALSSDEMMDRWLYAKPATKDEGAHYRAHGRWPADPEPLPPRTHNLPADPFEALTAEVEDRLAQVQQWLTVNAPIGTQVDCDKARNMQAELLDLNKRADAMHQVEKRPHLEAGRAVDRKYDFRSAVLDWAGRLRVVFEQFMRAEERRRREAAEARFREERAAAEAERACIEAEHAQKLADGSGLADPPPELPELPLAPEPVKVQAGGGVGRKAGLRDSYDFHITDYKLAALHVIEQPDVSAAVGKVIARMVRASKGKIEIPGVKVVQERKVA